MTSVREKLVKYRESKSKESLSQPVRQENAHTDPVARDSSQAEAVQSNTDINSGTASRQSNFHPLTTALKLGVWFLLWGISIEYGMGVVYVTMSGLLVMVYSLYGSRRRVHEPSAYSVFNKDCETIDGTLTAEQFEKELRYGPTNVRH